MFNHARASPKTEELSSDLLTNSFPPAQKQPVTPVSWSSQIAKKSASHNKKDRVEKYANYFKDGEILPIPDLVETVEPKILSAYLNIYGGVEQVTQITSSSGTAYGDYAFILCLNRRGFNAIH